ncbi:MAG: AAA family ATPase [Candidatus Zhuqueibacterota bacterium]
MLKRIRIKGYKSFKNLDVSLKNLSILFGPNASGKSNFLDAMQLLSRIATSRTLKEAFDPPYRGKPIESFALPEKGIKGLLEKESAKFEFEIEVELSESVINSVNRQITEMRKGKDDKKSEDITAKKIVGVKEKFLLYRIAIEIFPRSGMLRVADEYLAALNPDGEINKKRKPFLEHVENRLHLRTEGQAHPTYYERYLDHAIISSSLYLPHFPHVAALREELSRWLFFYFEPRERMRSPNPVKEVRHIGLMGEELAAYLNTLRAIDDRQLQAIGKTLHLIVPQIEKLEVDVNELGEVELKLFEGEIPVSARIISEGTLRILGLLAISGAKELPVLIGFEEPENGIHPRRIKMIADLLNNLTIENKTQLLVTTHSPTLLDVVDDKNLFVCRKTKEGTIIKPFEAWGNLARGKEIDQALNIEEFSISDRIMRGDFDA